MRLDLCGVQIHHFGVVLQHQRLELRDLLRIRAVLPKVLADVRPSVSEIGHHAMTIVLAVSVVRMIVFGSGLLAVAVVVCAMGVVMLGRNTG